jgi:pimeloyl-ACP methyl ester carboxylesterase
LAQQSAAISTELRHLELSLNIESRTYNPQSDVGRQGKPVLLLIHGAWFGGWSWDDVRLHLKWQGWQSETVELPSMAHSGSPRLGLLDDAEVVRQRIKDIGGPAVIVAHSYGGAVATQAAADLPNVRHLVYVSAFQLDVGESGLGLLGKPPDWWNIKGDVVSVHDPETIFFNDLPRDYAVQAVARLKPASLCIATQPLTAAAWRTISSTYIVTHRDNAVDPIYQKLLASRATYVRHLPAGHVPLLSLPSALADLILEAANTPADCSAIRPSFAPRGWDLV